VEATSKIVLDANDIRRTLVRIAHEIVEKNSDGSVALVGIYRRGAILAHRLHSLIAELHGVDVVMGEIDISFYRDDLVKKSPAPVVNDLNLGFDLTKYTVVLVDDVLFTGRTARAAIEAIFGAGRPARVQLATFIDRGHRELPIRPDFVGKNLPTSFGERVNVHVEEIDGIDEITISDGLLQQEQPAVTRKKESAARQIDLADNRQAAESAGAAMRRFAHTDKEHLAGKAGRRGSK
jgi:pyrimidine operon attenuation protein/uracil phosphoribosyltransferase